MPDTDKPQARRLPHGWLGTSLVVLVFLTVAACRRHQPRFDIRSQVSDELMRAANHGRDILDRDRAILFPKQVKRVWIDVGAHLQETTAEALKNEPDLGLVAIEPQSQCWEKWPDNPRLAAYPVALFMVRGTMDFHVNAFDETSSLAPSVPGKKK